MNDRRERAGQKHQADRAHPKVSHFSAHGQYADANPAEEKNRKDSLPDREEGIIRDHCPDRSAKVLRRRVWIDRVARPIGYVKTSQRQEQEEPQPGQNKQRQISRQSFSVHVLFAGRALPAGPVSGGQCPPYAVQIVPVCPNPPDPRSVASSSSTSISSTGGTGITTICAIRIPRSIVNACRP